MKKHSSQFHLPWLKSSSLPELTAWLGKKYALTQSPPYSRQLVFWDSFDWRLWRHGLVCFTEERLLHLADFNGKAAAEPLPLAAEPPSSWQELPDSELRQNLAALLQTRALLRQGEFSGTASSLSLMSWKGKTAALALLTETEQGCLLEFRAAPGAGRAFQRLARRLKRHCGSLRQAAAKEQLEAALANTGQLPGGSQFAPQLEPDMDCRQAAKRICLQLLDILRRNQPGVADNTDCEFLHDYRVALRRTRSALNLFKEDLEPEGAARFSAAFKALGLLTGPPRDLDVQLLTAEDSRARLPELLHPGLDSFFAGLTAQRAAEQDKLAQRLNAPEQEELLRGWQSWLEEEGKSGRPAGKTARRILSRRFARLLRALRSADSDAADAELHRLRIEVKKLRYALEFFCSLFPAAEMDWLTGLLKQLQDSLGLANDLAVQEALLARQLAAGLESGAATAVGGLLADLRQRREQARAGLRESFQLFLCRDKMKRARQLLEG
uniref:CHAD domain-containing protein n=1 Tax=Candidatus Electronema sp. TaxID=2698783 RepID=UPI00405696D4